MPSEKAAQQHRAGAFQDDHVQEREGEGGDPDIRSTNASPKERNGKDKSQNNQRQPMGGFDSTPLPHVPPGYILKITFHRASNLPMADINSLSSDPYISTQIKTGLKTRHKEDPYLRCRTPTVRKSTNPIWNYTWQVANIPADGFKLKVRIYDEDPADKDDRLGKVIVDVPSVGEGWAGIKEQGFKIRKRRASKRAYLMRAVAVCFNRAKHMHGELYISVEVLGRTGGKQGGHAYTIGPNYWVRHYSPMLGRIAGRKEPGDDEPGEKSDKKRTERYNFQANQFQLQGPVPAELYHRYVEFKPFVKGMFTAKGLRGFLLSKALHHQHRRVYNFDRSTVWGVYDHPCKDMTLQFLDLVHYDRGGRIFTYVLTLDALLRFTETGKEFGIDLLSKHTMHSNVSIYIAFSGEFFIRRLKHPYQAQENDESLEGSGKEEEEEEATTNPRHDIEGGTPQQDPPKDPAYYELVIDNDSGTYRPNAKLLPVLKRFLSRNFPGIKILTLDAQSDADRLSRMKEEQRELKKKEGDEVVYKQGSRRSSISSSDEEELEQMAQGQEQSHRQHPWRMAGRAFEEQGKGQLQHALHGKRREGSGQHDRDKPRQLAEGLRTQEGGSREGREGRSS